MDENSPFRLAEDVISKLDRLKEEVGLPDLDLVYDEIYHKNTRVGTQDRENVMKVFKFLLYSFVDWNIHDLANAISIGLDGKLNLAIDSGYVLDICSNFIVVDHSDYVQFAHLSVSEYLRRGRSAIVFSDIEAHAKIAEVCLAYVMSPNAQKIVKEREDHPRDLREAIFPEGSELGQTDTTTIIPDSNDNIPVHEASDIVVHSEERLPSSIDADYRNSLSKPLGFDSYAFALCLDHCELASVAKREEGTLCGLFTTFMSVVEPNAAFLSYIPSKPNAKTGSRIRRFWTAQSRFTDHRIKRVQLEAHPQDTFFAACAYGFTEILKNMMSSVVNVDVNKTNESGAPGIWVASRCGHFSTVELLLDEGAEVDIRHSHFGFTPLYEACIGGHANIAALLLSHGADASARFKGYYSRRFKFSIFKESEDVDDEVAEADETLLHAIVRARVEGAMPESEMSSVVSLLLKHGASIEAINPSFETPLHIACQGTLPVEVNVLLHHGASPGAQNLDGRTPLMYTVFDDCPQAFIVELLLKKATIADIVHRDKYGCSMLSLSLYSLGVKNESEDVTMLLLNTIDFQAARELGTPEGDEFVELADIIKKIGYDVLIRAGLEHLNHAWLSQRSFINCFQAIAEKVDLGKLDWYDEDYVRKESVRSRLAPSDTISEVEDDTGEEDATDGDDDGNDDNDADNDDDTADDKDADDEEDS